MKTSGEPSVKYKESQKPSQVLASISPTTRHLLPFWCLLTCGSLFWVPKEVKGWNWIQGADLEFQSHMPFTSYFWKKGECLLAGVPVTEDHKLGGFIILIILTNSSSL